jgi:ketosteroid isomerase-like protein
MKTNPIKYSLTLVAGACLAISAECSLAETDGHDAGAIAATAERFHHALAAGKPDEVISLLQPDALIVEGGVVETRVEYEGGHLKDDMAYAAAVPDRQLKVVVRQEGDVGWVTSTFRVQGIFQGKPVDSLAAETMVLSRTPTGWRIRSIHWSSRKAPRS